MVMSVGVCECGCSEFGHDVGGLCEELGQSEYEGWRQHRCTKECLDPCLVARCRDGFDGDGFWVWCRECDIQCSGSYEEWSDESTEEGVRNEELPRDFPHLELQLEIGSNIQVNFLPGVMTVTDLVFLTEEGDPVRKTHLDTPTAAGNICAIFASLGANDEEFLVERHEIVK